MKKSFSKIIRFVKPYFFIIKPFLKSTMIIVFLVVGISILSLVNPFVQKLFFDKVIMNKEKGLLIFLLLLQIAVSVIIALLSTVKDYLGTFISQSIEMNTKMAILKHILKLPIPFFDRIRTGEILQRIGDNSVILKIFNIFLEFILNFAHLIVFTIVLFLWNYKLTLLLVIFTPLKILFQWYIGQVNRKFEQPGWELNSIIQSEMVGSFMSIKPLKVYMMEGNFFKRMKYFNLKSRELNMFGNTVRNTLNVGFTFMSEMMRAILIFVGITEVIKGNLTIGSYMAFFALTGYITKPLNDIVTAYGRMQTFLNPINRLEEVLNCLPETERVSNVVIKNEHVCKDINIIRFEDVWFEYIKGQQILKGINFYAEKGEVVAFVGPSGVGKTTILNLLLKFYLPSSGNIFFNNQAISNMGVHMIRSDVGVVLQNPFVFSASIRDNLTLRRNGYSDEDIIKALNKVKLDNLVMKMKEGLDTKIGESGIKLSGGEKQRLTIARIFLLDYPVLIFDEPTSSMDLETEKIVQTSLLELFPSRITFIIAHRLSTIKKADRIYYMENGIIIEKGNHQQLMDLKGKYYQLYESASF